MSEGPEDLTLRYLRRMDQKLDKLSDDMLEIKQRIGALEEGMASLSRRLDRIDQRVDRIERRLDLVEPAQR